MSLLAGVNQRVYTPSLLNLISFYIPSLLNLISCFKTMVKICEGSFLKKRLLLIFIKKWILMRKYKEEKILKKLYEHLKKQNFKVENRFENLFKKKKDCQTF